jgi:hypothetical protein
MKKKFVNQGGGGRFSNKLKMACARDLKALSFNRILSEWVKNVLGV